MIRRNGTHHIEDFRLCPIIARQFLHIFEKQKTVKLTLFGDRKDRPPMKRQNAVNKLQNGRIRLDRNGQLHHVFDDPVFQIVDLFDNCLLPRHTKKNRPESSTIR